jgi:hypothetical protein
MAYFRNMQELENTDITKHPAYNNLSDENRKKVAETYTNVFNNNQGRMGIKIAQGIAFETAKKMCEGFDAAPGTIADEAGIVDTKVSSPGYHRESENDNHASDCAHWAGEKCDCTIGMSDHDFDMKHGEGASKGHTMKEWQNARQQERTRHIWSPASKAKEGTLPSDEEVKAADARRKEARKNALKEGDAEDFQAGNDALVGMTEADVPGADPEEGGAAGLLQKNHDAKCMNCGAVHPFDVVCFNGRSHSEAPKDGAGAILKANHLAKGMHTEESDAMISAVAGYLTNRAKVTGLMESLEEDAKDIQKKNLEDKCPNCGSVKKDGKCPECDPAKIDDKDKAYSKDDATDDAAKLLKKNHADKNMEEKYMGFDKLKNKLSHEKGVTDPGGLAAVIGKKKYGSKNFNTHKHMGEEEVNELEQVMEELWAENFFPAKPLEEQCVGCGHPKSYHISECQTCLTCPKFTTEASVDEAEKKTQICFCSHSYGEHGKGGCKSCKSEGLVEPSRAAHQFRANDYKEKFEAEYAQIFAAQQGKINTTMANAAMNWLPEELELAEGKGFDDIGPGDHVKFNHPLRGSDKTPQQGKGKVVMRSSHGGWVLNMGGKHGTPGLVDRNNYVSHRKAKTVKEDERGVYSQMDTDAMHRDPVKPKKSTSKKNANRKAREQAMRDLGLKKAKGALGGTYWESEQIGEDELGEGARELVDVPNKQKKAVEARTGAALKKFVQKPVKEETDPLMVSALDYINSEVSRSGGKLFKVTEDTLTEDKWKVDSEKVLKNHGFDFQHKLDMPAGKGSAKRYLHPISGHHVIVHRTGHWSTSAGPHASKGQGSESLDKHLNDHHKN